MKKFLAVCMAALMLFTGSALVAFAADEEDPSEPESATEAEITYNTYELAKDHDFDEIQYMTKGNENATILHEGDHIVSFKSSSVAMKIDYYPDADGVTVKGWTPQDPNNLAFSTSGKVSFRDDSFSRNEEGVIKGLDFTDFTIAYSDENTFVGWAVRSYQESTNVLSVYGVWEKGHKVPSRDDVDDFYYIVDFFYTLRKNIASPFFKIAKAISNAMLFVKQWLYDKVFAPKTAV